MSPQEWSVLNRERGELIKRSIASTLTATEAGRLEELQRIADAHLEEVALRSTEVLDALEAQLGISKPFGPGHRVRVTGVPDGCKGKLKWAGRLGSIHRENDVAPGYWYVKLDGTPRGKARRELIQVQYLEPVDSHDATKSV